MDFKYAKYWAVGAFAALGVGLVAVSRRHSRQKRYLAISLGGTHAKLCILQKNEHINAFTIIGEVHDVETKTPAEFIEFIKSLFKPSDFDEVAIASFGPLSLRPDSNYGQLLVAPSEQKKPWERFSLAGALRASFGKPAHVETDVNAAAVAEFRLGSHGAINSLAYITIGTGVGVGLVVGGKTVHGYLHPEGGHMM